MRIIETIKPYFLMILGVCVASAILYVIVKGLSPNTNDNVLLPVIAGVVSIITFITSQQNIKKEKIDSRLFEKKAEIHRLFVDIYSELINARLQKTGTLNINIEEILKKMEQLSRLAMLSSSIDTIKELNKFAITHHHLIKKRDKFEKRNPSQEKKTLFREQETKALLIAVEKIIKKIRDDLGYDDHNSDHEILKLFLAPESKHLYDKESPYYKLFR